jgi:hypothetical protein
MSNNLTALMSLVVSVFREKSKTSCAVPDWFGSFLSSDPVHQKSQHSEYRREPYPCVLFREGGPCAVPWRS